MTSGLRRLSSPVLALLFLLPPSAVWGQVKWTWKDRHKKTRTSADLNHILRDHELWLASEGSNGKFADLRGADLSDANLEQTNLREVNLARADLSNAKMEGANLRDANMMGVELWNAHLEAADLRGAKLIGADATSAHLNSADLRNAELQETDFDGADLQNAVFEPQSIPQVGLIARAKNFKLLTYQDDSNALANYGENSGTESS